MSRSPIMLRFDKRKAILRINILHKRNWCNSTDKNTQTQFFSGVMRYFYGLEAVELLKEYNDKLKVLIEKHGMHKVLTDTKTKK